MFDHLLGNQAVKDAIRRFISTGRVPNSLLLAGPDGVGKRQFALQFAKAIVCHDPVEHEGCGKCTSCLRVEVFKFPAADNRDEHEKVIFSEHADVGQVIPYGRNVLAKAIRDLEKEANFRPFEANARVFIIDEAHRMNATAANALLKTLEEPPATSHIFLVTSRPNALLPTIRSRVQTLRFGPVDESEIEHLLLTTHKYSQDDAQLVAFGSNGSVSRAVSTNIEEFRELRTLAITILRDALISRDLVAVLRLSEKVTAQRSTSEYEMFLDVLQGLIHQVWTVCIDHASARAGGEIKELAKSADPTKLAGLLDHIEELRASLLVNVNKKIVTDDLLVKMATN